MRETSFVSTTAGAADSLTCFCYGVPLPAEAVWKKNGVPVFASSSKPISNIQEFDPDFKLTSILTFTSPSPGDIAEYTCDCTNSFRGNTFSDSSSIELRVVTQASVQWDASNPSISAYGSLFQITCTASGLPRPTEILWSRKKSTSTSDQFSNIITGEDFTIDQTDIDVTTIQSILTFKSTAYGDDGAYNCYAENKINDVLYSRNGGGNLLIFQNPTVVLEPKENAAAIDSTVSLTCVVNSKPAPSKIDWYFKDAKLTNQPTSILTGFERRSTYPVQLVGGNSEGKYMCKGYHTYEGREATGETHAYVRLYRPVVTIMDPGSSRTVNEYTALTLTCTALGVPEVPEFSWSINSPILDSQDITSDIGVVETEVNYDRGDLNLEVTSRLRVASVKYINLGTYTCSTTQSWLDEVTAKKQEVAITVNFDAKLMSGTGSTGISQNVGSQVRLTCEVYGNPVPDDVVWSWVSTGNQISGEGDEFTLTEVLQNKYKKTSTLQFTFLPQYHSRDLYCSSRNALSSAEQTLAFTLNMNPNTMAIILNGKVEEDETIVMTCLTTFQTGVITWLRDFKVIEELDRYTYSSNPAYSTKNSVFEIQDLDSGDDSGNYTCTIVEGATVVTQNYHLLIGEAVVGGGGAAATGGLSQGVIIALIVLGIFIAIVLILICIVFVHGRRRKGIGFRHKNMPDTYENHVYNDKSLPPATLRDTTLDNLPKVVQPLSLSKNELDHDVREATIMQQATLSQQRNRNPNLGRAATLNRGAGRNPGAGPEPAHYTLDHRDKSRDWY